MPTSSPLAPSHFGLYVHLPWCIKKCPYCDFNSHAVRGVPEYDQYIEALILDFRSQAERFALTTPFSSVFFGGGTPSLFRAEQLARVLDEVRAANGLTIDAEITLEANPGALEHDEFAAYRDAGINRVSLGVQSFNDQQLKQLGRVHSAREAHQAAEAIHAAGIGQLNLDLMYGLPDQSIEQAMHDIEQVLELQPTHISHYQLTLEPNTLFAAKPPRLPDSDRCYDMQTVCQQQLADASYAQYEISAYATEGAQCRHNLTYWRFDDYLGIGAGAHGKLSAASGRIERTTHRRHPSQYMSDPLLLTTQTVTPSAALFEFMLNQLRLREEVHVEQLKAKTGAPLERAESLLAVAASRGLLEPIQPGRWRKTSLGERFLNDLQEIFLP